MAPYATKQAAMANVTLRLLGHVMGEYDRDGWREAGEYQALTNAHLLRILHLMGIKLTDRWNYATSEAGGNLYNGGAKPARTGRRGSADTSNAASPAVRTADIRPDRRKPPFLPSKINPESSASMGESARSSESHTPRSRTRNAFSYPFIEIRDVQIAGIVAPRVARGRAYIAPRVSPNRSSRWLCAQAVLLLFGGATLHAQAMVPVADFPPPFPAQHSFIFGLVASPAPVGLDINLVTTAEVYRARFYSGTSLVFAKYLDASSQVVLDEASLAVPIPDKLLYTSAVAFQPSISSLEIATGGVTSFPIDVVDYPTGFAVDPSGAMYLYTTDGVAKYANVTTGTRSFTMGGSGSGAGQLSIPGGAVTAGPGGALYALDPGNNRVVRFDTTTGTYLGSIALIGTNASNALVLSPSGRLYTANGNGGGTVYDALTGAVIETFSSSVANPDAPGLGNAVLFLDGRGFLYLYDVATGMHVFSDPASVAAGADLGVTISGPGSITAGTNISYNVRITKNGASDAINATLTDVLPANTTFVSAVQTSGPAFTCTNPAVGATGSASCTIATFPALTSATFTIVLKVDANIADGLLITNTASASSAAPDPISGNDSATTTATVNIKADVAVAKSGPIAVTSGSDVIYTCTVTNNGPNDAQSVVMIDALALGTTFVSEAQTSGPTFTCTNPAVGASGSVSCTIPTLAVGASAVFALVVKLGANFSGATLTNTVSVSSATTDQTPGNNSASSVATVDPGAQTIVAVSDFSPAPGHSSIIGLVAGLQGISSPAGPLVCLGTTEDVHCAPVYAGTSLSFIEVLNVYPDVPLMNETSLVALHPQDSKKLLFTEFSFFGANVTTYAVATPPVVTSVVIDGNDPSTLPAGLALDPSGAMYAFTSTGVGKYANSSTGTRSLTMGGSGSGAGQLSIPGGALAVGPGGGVLYALDPGNNRVVRFDTSTGNYLGNIPLSGTTATTALAISANGRLYTANGLAGGTVYDAVSGALLDTFNALAVNPEPPFPSNGSTSILLDGRGYIYLYDAATGMHVFSDPASASTDLAVSNSAPASITAGSDVTYNVTVTNNGPNSVQSVTLSDPLPAGTTFVSEAQDSGPAFTCTNPAVGAAGSVSCTIATLASGASATFTLVFRTNANATSGSTITNIATVSYVGGDPIPGNNSASTQATVSTSADLAVTQSGPLTIVAGNNITYTITLTNNGPSDSQSVALTDPLPAGTTFVSEAQDSGPTFLCTNPAVGATGSVSCTIATLASGVSATFTLVFRVNASATSGSTITNIATISSLTSDPATGNNSASTPAATVSTSADLGVTKSGPPTIVAGNNITYTVTATNNGPSDAQSVTLSDTLPAGTSFVSLSSPGGWSCTTPAVGAGGAVSCSNASVPIGDSVFTLTVAVGGGVPDSTIITNTATVSSSTSDPNTGNESDTATTTVGISSADLSVTKTATPDPVMAGTNLTYTITVNNAGPSDATTAALSDTLPSGTTFVSLVSPGGWSCTTPAAGAAGTVSCSIATMPVGSNVFTLTVAVSSTAAAGSVLTNIAMVTSDSGDPNPGNESSTATTDVISPATLSATKTASGTFSPGSTLMYTIVISSSGPAGQSDNLGDELVDVLPPQLTLITATATSGSAVATVGTNTVAWNGAIPAGGSVTITIQVLIEANAAVGSTITNQATLNYDADGDGTNEATTGTDDPSQTGSGNSTGFVVAPATLADIPALDGLGLAALAALLAGLGLLVMRRS